MDHRVCPDQARVGTLAHGEVKSGAAKLELHRIGYPTTDAPTDIDTLQRRIVELEQLAITVGRQLYVSIRLNRNAFRIICHVRPATPSTLRGTPITRHSGVSKNDYAGTMVDEGIEMTAPPFSSVIRPGVSGGFVSGKDETSWQQDRSGTRRS